MINQSTRQNLIALLDLTALNETDTPETIKLLCQKAVSSYGKVAAVCVYTKFIPLVKTFLSTVSIPIATVCNFPNGNQSLEHTLHEIHTATLVGADEIDLVMPYQEFLAGKINEVYFYLKSARNLLKPQQKLKIILETGAFHTADQIASATECVINAGAHFVKTSTGKISTGATPEAAEIILKTIKQSNPHVGLKISGGIRQAKDALIYLQLAEKTMGESWVNPQHFRIGASRLIDELLEEN